MKTNAVEIRSHAVFPESINVNLSPYPIFHILTWKGRYSAPGEIMRRRPFLINIAFDIWMLYMKISRQKNIKYLSIETDEL